jgi:hypothetical protein
MPTKEQWAKMSPERKQWYYDYGKHYYYEHREKRLNAARKWQKDHREIVRARARADGRRERGLLVVGDKQRVGVCPICLGHKVLVPDHVLGIDRVRDWLCQSCNLLLGQFEAREHNGLHDKFRAYLARFT